MKEGAMLMRIGAGGYPHTMAPGPAGRSEPGFRLQPRQAAAAASPVSSPGGLLALGATMASPRDGLARRRGRALLGGLDALQRAMLGGGDAAAALHGLAGLVEGEDGDDPDLAEAMRGLALRARIELVRRGMDRGQTVSPPR